MINTLERVVITGMAASTCLGLGVAQLCQRLSQGLQAKHYGASIMRLPQIRHDIAALIRKTRTDHELTQHLLAAVEYDLGPSLVDLDEDTKAHCGVVIGNCTGHLPPYLEVYTTAICEGFACVNPVHFPATLCNYATVQLNNGYGLKGSSTTISSGFAAGLDAIGYAAMQIQQGQDRLVLAGGIEGFNEPTGRMLICHDAVSPSRLIRPLHEGHDGTIFAEGVGVLMIEPLSQTCKTGKQTYGEILGYGTTRGQANKGEAYLRQKAVESVHQALRMADLQPADIEAIFPSANGSITGDAFEARVLQQLFGPRLQAIPVYPIKAIIGECLTASGALQCLAAAYALTQAESPREAQQSYSAVGLDALWLPDHVRPCNTALVYSFGLDRTFTTLILGKIRG